MNGKEAEAERSRNGMQIGRQVGAEALKAFLCLSDSWPFHGQGRYCIVVIVINICLPLRPGVQDSNQISWVLDQCAKILIWQLTFENSNKSFLRESLDRIDGGAKQFYNIDPRGLLLFAQRLLTAQQQMIVLFTFCNAREVYY